MSVRTAPEDSGRDRATGNQVAVRERLDGGELQGDETLDATATITVAGLSGDVVVTGQIFCVEHLCMGYPRAKSRHPGESRPAGHRQCRDHRSRARAASAMVPVHHARPLTGGATLLGSTSETASAGCSRPRRRASQIQRLLPA